MSSFSVLTFAHS